MTHPARTARSAELAQAAQFFRKHCADGAGAALEDEEVERLLLAVLLNAQRVMAGGQVLQGLFPEVGAMVNHSCRPNLQVAAVCDDGGELRLVLRAARDIAAGEELTVTYLESLYLPFADRDEQLRELHHAFGAEALSTDAGLEALIPLDAEAQEKATQLVVTANNAAHDAWEKLAELQSTSAGDAAKEKEMQRHRAMAALQYAAVLNAGLLAETHTWRYNATSRLAMLLSQAGPAAPASCKKALPLWASAIRAGARVWPSEKWPEHRALLRGAHRAAIGAGDEAQQLYYAAKLEELEGPHGDVAKE